MNEPAEVREGGVAMEIARQTRGRRCGGAEGKRRPNPNKKDELVHLMEHHLDEEQHLDEGMKEVLCLV